jgi:glycosyltransferase involved in cell wall biosynthesis
MPKPDISMFFPAYNEESNIAKVLNSAAKLLDEIADDYEILAVVYEGSTDRTAEIVKELGRKNKKIRLVLQPKGRKGIGYAKIIGFKSARFPYIFYADSDNQFDLDEFRKFLPYIGKYDIIAGYRIKRHDPKARIIVSKVYNTMMRFLFGAKERDLDCAFRLVNKKVIGSISLISSTGVATTELLAKARKKGFKIKEIGVAHFPRTAGQSAFETKGLSLPKPREVYKILKETARLWIDMHIKGN